MWGNLNEKWKRRPARARLYTAIACTLLKFSVNKMQFALHYITNTKKQSPKLQMYRFVTKSGLKAHKNIEKGMVSTDSILSNSILSNSILSLASPWKSTAWNPTLASPASSTTTKHKFQPSCCSERREARWIGWWPVRRWPGLSVLSSRHPWPHLQSFWSKCLMKMEMNQCLA